jgi:glucosamine kinase
LSGRLLLGVDAGGSRTRCRLVEGRDVVAEWEGPGTNPAALTEAVVERRLAALLAGLPGRPEVACVGAAGAEVPAARARLERVLARLLPGTSVTVVHDARLVLAAAGRAEGVALISGTGSVAYARDRAGREARAGGWGWLLGDDGSGAWIVRQAAREVMRRRDAGEPRGALGQGLMEAARAIDEADLSGRLHRLREPRRWASLAGAVFAAAGRDPGADRLISEAAAGLAGLVAAVRDRLPVGGPVILSGGLLLGRARLADEVTSRLGGDAVPLEEPPVAGAVRLAREQRAG